MSETTTAIQGWVIRLQEGDTNARQELLNLACERLRVLTRSMKRDFGAVQRWEETDDIFQRAAMRLYDALSEVVVNDVQHFLRLAAMQIRRELVDASRKFHGPQGIGRNHASQIHNSHHGVPSPVGVAFDPAEVTGDPAILQEWNEFHLAIDSLPEDEREVVDLLYYHGMTQEDAAEVLDCSASTVKRTWRRARRTLAESLDGGIPGI